MIRYYAKVVGGTEIELSEVDYLDLQRRFQRNIIAMVSLENGDMLMSDKIYLLASEEISKKPVAGTVKTFEPKVS